MELIEAPASVGQRLLWFLGHFRSKDRALSCPVIFRATGPLTAGDLEAAVDLLVQRHEALRTTYAGRGRRLVQRVHAPRRTPVIERRLGDESELAAALDRELATPIDATDWPLRLTLLRIGPEDAVFCLNLHHLGGDAWSGGVLFRELVAALDARGAAPDLPAVAWQYRDFSEFQAQLLASDESARHREFFAEALLGACAPRIPVAPEPPAGSSVQMARARSTVPLDRVRRLEALAVRSRATLFSVLLAAYFCALRRVTGQDDLTVTTLYANRQRPELRHTVGFIANLVPIRARLSGAHSVERAIEVAHRASSSGFVHQAIPYQMLPSGGVERADVRPDDIVFQMMPEPMGQVRARGATLQVLVPDGVGSRFLLEMSIAPHPAGLDALLFYRADRIDSGVAEQLLRAYAEEIERFARAEAPRPQLWATVGTPERAARARIGPGSRGGAPPVRTSS